MHEMRTYFNLSEANELLPRLEYLFSEIARVQGDVNELYQSASDAGIALSTDVSYDWKKLEVCGVPSINDKMRALSEEYLALADEIAGTGVLLCDIEQGIVGFYSWFEGQEILLSWQYGEPEVSFWHSVSEGAVTRRSIAELFVSEENATHLH